MMDSIDIFNVKFGDCFILNNANNKSAMLVDFGSDNRIENNMENH